MKTTWAVTALACYLGLFTATGFSFQEDGAKKTDENVEVKGTIVIVGKDGKQQVIELGEGDEVIELQDLQGKLGNLKLKRFQMPENLDIDLDLPVFAGMKYYIGVSCTNTSEALRSHLDLQAPCLLVTNVADDSPASKAGVQANDIIVSAGDQSIESISDLAQAVQNAGKEEISLTINLIRKGQEQSVEVTPVKREKLDIPKVDIDSDKMKELVEKAMKNRKIPKIDIPHLDIPSIKIDPEKIREHLKSIPDFKELKIPDDKIKNLEEKVEQLKKLIEEMQNDKDDDK